MTGPVTRRPERPEDAAFRFELFQASRPPGQDLAGLEAPLRAMLLRQSFAGQTATYASRYPDARHEILERDAMPIGRMVVDAAPDAVTLVDIALAPGARGRGIGTGLLLALRAEAGDRPVHLSVAAGHDAALRLYLRLGFEIVATNAAEVSLRRGADDRQPLSRGRAYPDRVRLPLSFDAAPLAAEVAALASHDWIAHFVTWNYAGDWSVIPLRGMAGAMHPVMMIHADPSCRDFADTPLLAACPAIRAVLAAFACPLECVRLMRLGPGAIIREHVDHDLDVAQGAVRVHVPITTNPDAVFTLNGTRVAMEPGSAWYLRLADPHAVANHGTTARVHLVIDARVTPWVEALLARGMDTARAPA